MPKSKSDKPLPFKQFTVGIDIYGTSVHFILTRDLQRAAKVVRRILGDKSANWFLENADTANGLTLDGSLTQQPPIIWLPQAPMVTSEAAAMAHEIFHAVNLILMDCGVELTRDGESYAYLIAHVTHQALNKMFAS